MFTASKFPLYRQHDAMQCGVACLHVAGLAALILERNPRLTAAKVREIIARNTKKVGDEPYSVNKPYGTWNEFYGYGLIDAFQAVINTPRN